MRRRRSTCVSVLAFVALSAFLVSGCTSSTSDDAVSPEPSASPAAAASPVSAFDCAELLPGATADQTMGTAVVPLSGADSLTGNPDTWLPLELRQRGGAYCTWQGVDSGADPRLRPSLNLRIAPLGLKTPPGSPESSCYRDGPVAPVVSCSASRISNGYRVGLESTGTAAAAVSDDELAARFEDVVATVGERLDAMGSPAPEWQPPTGAAELPAVCDGFIPRADVGAILRPEFPFAAEQGMSAPTIEPERFATMIGCPWVVDVTGVPFAAATLTAWEGGEWAWEEMRSVIRPSAEPLAVAGVPDGNAWLSCVAPADGCAVDMIVGGNWIDIRLGDRSDPGERPDFPERVFAAEPRVALPELAAAVAARLTD